MLFHVKRPIAGNLVQLFVHALAFQQDELSIRRDMPISKRQEPMQRCERASSDDVSLERRDRFDPLCVDDGVQFSFT